MILPWCWTGNLASIVSVLLVLHLCGRLFAFSSGFDTRLFADSFVFLISCSIAIIAGTYFSQRRAGAGNLSPAANWTRAARRLRPASSSLKKTNALVQSEKLARWGRMSAGISTRSTNPLTSPTTGLFTLRKKASTSHRNSRRTTPSARRCEDASSACDHRFLLRSSRIQLPSCSRSVTMSPSGDSVLRNELRRHRPRNRSNARVLGCVNIRRSETMVCTRLRPSSTSASTSA